MSKSTTYCRTSSDCFHKNGKPRTNNCGMEIPYCASSSLQNSSLQNISTTCQKTLKSQCTGTLEKPHHFETKEDCIKCAKCSGLKQGCYQVQASGNLVPARIIPGIRWTPKTCVDTRNLEGGIWCSGCPTCNEVSSSCSEQDVNTFCKGGSCMNMFTQCPEGENQCSHLSSLITNPLEGVQSCQNCSHCCSYNSENKNFVCDKTKTKKLCNNTPSSWWAPDCYQWECATLPSIGKVCQPQWYGYPL